MPFLVRPICLAQVRPVVAPSLQMGWPKLSTETSPGASVRKSRTCVIFTGSPCTPPLKSREWDRPVSVTPSSMRTTPQSAVRMDCIGSPRLMASGVTWLDATRSPKRLYSVPTGA